MASPFHSTFSLDLQPSLVSLFATRTSEASGSQYHLKISFATFGKTIEEYKKFKSLGKQNLRDHMNDLELIFNMLGEKVTTEITKKDDAHRLNECKIAAKKGGDVAGRARKGAEEQIGEPIVTGDNYLDIPEKVKRLAKKTK